MDDDQYDIEETKLRMRKYTKGGFKWPSYAATHFIVPWTRT